MLPGYLRQLCQNMARVNRIATNTILDKSDSHEPGQGTYTAFRRSVGGASSQHALVIMGADIDDISALSLIYLLLPPGPQRATSPSGLLKPWLIAVPIPPAAPVTTMVFPSSPNKGYKYIL